MRARFVVASLLATCGVCLPACFEFEARVDAGLDDDPEGVIAGQILEGQTSGLSATKVQLRDGAPPSGRSPNVEPPSSVPGKDAFLPGELIVSFRRNALDKAQLATSLDTARVSAGLTDIRLDVDRCGARTYCRVWVRDDKGGLVDKNRTRAVEQALWRHKPSTWRALTVNHVTRGLREPNDDHYPFQWNYRFMNLEAAWDLEVGKDEVVVAVVDSGGVLGHPDLTDRWARNPQNNTIIGMDFVSSGDLDSFPGIDTDPEDPGDGALGDRSSFHGTHIAGTIGASTDNNEGVAGVTWHSRILPVRVLGANLNGSEFDLINGLVWALGDEIEGAPQNLAPARVINISIGLAGDADNQPLWDDLMAAIFADTDNLFAHDPVIVAAVGNDDKDAANVVPANVAGVLAVGAIGTVSGVRAPYSNFGSVVDIMAPGGDDTQDLTEDGLGDGILSTYDNEYDYAQGTSMASPHVTGLAALLVSQNSELTHTQVEEIIKVSADPRGACNEGCGAGMIDAFQALLLTGAEVDPVARMVTDTNTLFYGEGVNGRTLQVFNTGTVAFDFVVSVVGPQANLFTADVDNGRVGAAGPDGQAALAVNLNRTSFESGSANLVIRTVGLEPEQEAVINLSFNDDPNRAPRLMDRVEVGAYRNRNGALEKVASVVTTREDAFRYEIVGLAKGEYYVMAIGDDNRDGAFDDDIESVGGFPTVRAPEPVTVPDDGRVDDVDFSLPSRFITDVVGGVGAPCNGDGDCTFAEDAECILTFEGGYCTRACDVDGVCDNNASCETLSCDGEDCGYCLVTCFNDAQCRFAEGYECDQFHTCAPASFNE